MLRGLYGALQWPATQGAPQMSCSVTMLQGTVTKATIRANREINKFLRLAKTHQDVTYPRRHGCRWHELGFLALGDAAWATSNKGKSQGSYFITILPKEPFAHRATTFAVLDWKSFEPNRVFRSIFESRNPGRNNGCRCGGISKRSGDWFKTLLLHAKERQWSCKYFDQTFDS